MPPKQVVSLRDHLSFTRAVLVIEVSKVRMTKLMRESSVTEPLSRPNGDKSEVKGAHIATKQARTVDSAIPGTHNPPVAFTSGAVKLFARFPLDNRRDFRVGTERLPHDGGRYLLVRLKVKVLLTRNDRGLTTRQACKY